MLPSEYGRWDLLRLAAGENKFTGTLPESYGNWTNIDRFEVENNQLYGTIPSSYASRSKLGQYRFNIQNNMLTGDIPEGFKNRSSSTGFVYISNNCLNVNLTGDIGEWLDLKAMER
ncbi:MAG: hypothetical protein LBG52_02995 [Candidatus Peribacteria bacterium]|nr:hypothetical protein [Candidatus Peribacteria bacterium]